MISRIGMGLLVWNGEKTIRTTINSLLKQSVQNFDLIIFDNRSTDKTLKIANEIKKKNNTKIKIKIIKDYKKRKLVNSQKFLIKNYLNRYKYICVISDDDFYHPEFLETLHKKIIKDNLSMVYCGHNYFKSKNNFYKVKNYPIYDQSSSYSHNLSKFIVHRNMVPAFFGIFLSEKYISSLKYFYYYDKTESNYDTLFLSHFLLNNKIGYVKKVLFSYRDKDRYKIQKVRNHKVYVFNEFKTCLLIFFYQFNLSKNLAKIAFKNQNINLFNKIIIFLLIVITYFQKSISFIFKKFYGLIN
jgi:glycosyltransferase involved in cell wall biosynthesis